MVRLLRSNQGSRRSISKKEKKRMQKKAQPQGQKIFCIPYIIFLHVKESPNHYIRKVSQKQSLQLPARALATKQFHILSRGLRPLSKQDSLSIKMAC